jgi:hypothetical protein
MNVKIDEARGYHETTCIKCLRSFIRLPLLGSNCNYLAILQKNVRDIIEPRSRIDHAAATNEE